MAETITTSDVKDGFDTELPDTEVQLAITLIDQADDCLDKNSVPADIQKALKVYGARHILTMQTNSGRGTVSQQSSPSGASRSFSAYRGDNGSKYMDLLKQLDKHGCVRNQLENRANLYLKVAGVCK